MKHACLACSFLAAGLVAAAPLLTTTNPAAVLLPRQDGLPELLSCPASSWPPTTVGTLNSPQEVGDELASLLADVSPANIQATIEKLVSFVTRATLSVDISNSTFGIGGARDWLYGQYSAYAAASDKGAYPFLNSYIQQPDGERVLVPVNISNPGLFLPGTNYKSPEDPGRVYVISGHYDSRNTDPTNYEDPAPGADDDASGVSASLELARIFSSPSAPALPASLVFVAVAGEEQGLYGAENLAFTYRNATPPINVEAMLNCDTIGSPNARSAYDTGNAPSTSDAHTIRLFAQGLPPLDVENATVRAQRLSIGGENDSPTRNLARFIKEVAENDATAMTVAVINRLDRFLRGGDHTPFLNAGYPAVRFTEPYEDYRHQHQDVRVEDGEQFGDLLEFVDFEYTARVAGVNLAALYSLAKSPGMVREVRVNTSELTNDSTFLWRVPADGEAAVGGYEVVWRATTAPFWQKVLDVQMGEAVEGDEERRRVTVDVSKDNVVFGVRARSVDGFRGVAVLPFPVT